jgi:tRNA(fMet)-specific endonuclease VapC
MSFLLDTDTCSGYLNNHPRAVKKVMLHFGGLHLSVVTVGELLTWARRAKAPPNRLVSVQKLLVASTMHEIDLAIADKFGEVRASSLDRGITVGEMDLLNGCVALVHNLTMVTHNTKDYANIPGLTMDDWLVP